MFDRIEGRARRLGDDINTDYIIASTRKRDTLDESVLKQYLLETVDPAFAASVLPGDILVAGSNFGCGSAMEIATTVILAAGIRAVIAESFARTFYRNAINNGLWTIECDTTGIVEGAYIAIAERSGAMVVETQDGNSATARVVRVWPSGIALDILMAGGLVPYLRDRSALKTTGGRSPDR